MRRTRSTTRKTYEKGFKLKLITAVALVALSGISTLYGAASVKFELFPYPQIMKAKHAVAHEERTPYYLGRKSFFDQHGKHFSIVMAGDSITDHAEWGELFETSTIANRGIGGDTTDGLLERMESLYSTQADKTFVMIGINDIAKDQAVDTIFNNYTQVLELLTTHNMHPHIQSTLFAGKKKDQYNERVRQLNDRLSVYAAEKHIPFIDLNALLAQNNLLNEAYTTDGVHLNSQGYAIWAEAIRPYITASLSSARQ